MQGRIREDSIADVRDRARIDDVISTYVTLQRAGGGQLKGLCPFHDEKSPSFNVTPSRGFYHCFGCGEGGDVISFLMKIDGLTFFEAVERLAERFGVDLKREELPDRPGMRGGAPEVRRGPSRKRLVEANKAAEAFFQQQLNSPEAISARTFLSERGFDQAASAHFGIGYAPQAGEALTQHLRGLRFTDEEVKAADLVRQGRGLYDRFRGRLMWPIREAGGDTIGFGARKLYDDDTGPKYLNTGETPIYKKSHVLYGLDLARKDIANGRRAVIVEGYTDVMACHLAGETTAVATCGTAFGEDHTRVLRRFLDDRDGSAGEVIFTFDGDAAGQKAALKAFSLDQSFVSQTYVAVEPSGMDPCDLRLAKGDEAVRELINTREPLYRFVLGNVLARYDLDRADARVDALRDAAGLVSSIRDQTKVEAFARELSQMIGIDVDVARNEVLKAARRPARDTSRDQRQDTRRSPGQPEAPAQPVRRLPNLKDPRFAIERETLKLVLQYPKETAPSVVNTTPGDFTHPVYRGVWERIVASGGAEAGVADAGWAGRVRSSAGDVLVASAISELGTEALITEADPPGEAYVTGYVFKLAELTVARRIADLKSKLQRSDPSDTLAYNALFGELVALEQHRRTLRERAVGG